MAEESQVVAPIYNGPVEVLVPPQLELPVPAQVVTTPSPDEVRATEAVFTRDQESDKVLGLLGMWTGTLLLHDLAVEHFEGREEEEKEPKKKRKE